MSLTLAIDCAMRWLNLGLADGDLPLGAEAVNADRGQSAMLAGAVEGFLSRNGVSLRDLRLIAVTNGPGYYTGIRVGLSYATALAESLGIPIAPVCTLYAMAFPYLRAGFITVPVLKAGRDSIYCAAYKGSETIAPPAFCAPDELTGAVLGTLENPSDVLVTGFDALQFDEIKNCGATVLPTPPAIGLDLAVCAASVRATDPAAVTAIYLRSPG
ncbi:MAG: tRNA (adenosine(37)-N6)-threonylcarbamoyltransferase complex dimerization subunit type 1 TsaB [Synergistaceae bacterium]|nr:tRNA (adenosine(37)-N6)-threonylcarbamoyltransferase complex dimerization subunit type 1 TsaB [Synergistaceae bacterium]